jgi:hypothetical protein
VYAARWTQLARMARPTAYALGHAGVSIVSLHAFAEIHHLFKTGKVMSGEERFRVVFNNLIMVTAFSLGSHIVTAPETRLPAPVLEFVRKRYGTRFKVLEGRRKKVSAQLDKLRSQPESVEVSELLAELESLYNTEFTLIGRAAKEGRFAPDQVKAALDAYAKPVRALEIEFARMGMPFGPEDASMFRPIGGQIVEFRSDGLQYLRAHYDAAKGELTPIGDGLYRGVIRGEVTYWLARGKPLPKGGMRGAEVLPLADAPLLGPRDVPRLRGLLRRMGLAGQLRHRATFEPQPVEGASTLTVPLATGSVDVRVEIHLRTPTERAGHGLETGHARNSLTFDGTHWKAVIEIDPRLRPEDADLGVVHEANEVAGIVRRLHGQSLTGRALERAISEQQQSSLTREGARGREPTEHDIATAIDLVTLWQRFGADPSPTNRQILERQIRAMGFEARYFAMEVAPRQASSAKPDRSYNLSPRTRDQMVRDVAPSSAVADALLAHIDAWRTATFEQTPFRAADRRSIAARILEYADALANRGPRRGPFQGSAPAGAMDLIEMLAQAARNRDRLTVEDLVRSGMPRPTAEQVVNSLDNLNPYRTLYAELESLISLRHRVEAARASGGAALATSVGYGFRRDLTAVRAMTRGGRIDGLGFAQVLRRLQHALAVGQLVPGTGDPLRPQFTEPADASSAVRLTWRFRPGHGAEADSLFSIDLPGVVKGRPFQLGDMVHADFEPVKSAGGHQTEHLTETGVVVPPGSAPAHIYIVPDAAFAAFVDALGLAAQRIRLERPAHR